MNFVNLTPHAINLNNGQVFMPSGLVARVSTIYSDVDSDGVATVSFGDVQGLPSPMPDILYVVSAVVQQAGKLAGRTDLVAPATGASGVIRDDKGQIVSVPFFVRS